MGKNKLAAIGLLAFLLFIGVRFSFGSVPARAAGNIYYVATDGNDSNPGTKSKPWETIGRATSTAIAGDTILIRAGTYKAVFGGWVFSHSGTAQLPITLTNFPGDRVIIGITEADHDYMAFRCWNYPDWQTPDAEYIRVVGTNVNPAILSNGVTSKKGIVIQGPYTTHTHAAGFRAVGCHHWEIGGIDFVDVGFAVFTYKKNYQTNQDHTTKYWYIHDNRVYGFYNEDAMQFEGDYNTIENNEFYKVVSKTYTPFGCQQLLLNGHHNIVRGNVMSPPGGQRCPAGITLEWDMADYNIIERNRIYDTSAGVKVAGGDNNIIRNNLIYMTQTPDLTEGGIEILSHDNYAGWPCNEVADTPAIVPGDDPSAPDYQYYFSPRNCHSYGNQIYNNTIHRYHSGIMFYDLVPENTIIRNNAISKWVRASICNFNPTTRKCNSLPAGLIADHNAYRGVFGFKNVAKYNFRITKGSTLKDTGYNLGSLVPYDFAGTNRPRGRGFDIGAYEYIPLP